MQQDYLRKSISDLVSDINSICFLPDIQRDFVWKPAQVCALFDSLMRDYPIGTLLLWSVDGEFLASNQIKRLRFVDKSDQTNTEDTSYEPQKDYLLALDGQQRLTTFYLVLKGNYIIRNKPYDLYFNILSGKNETDALLYEFQFFNSAKGQAFKDDSDNGNSAKLWYKVKYIHAFEDIDSVSEDIKGHAEQHFGVAIDREQRKALTKLYRLLRYEKILYYYPEKEKDYDKVLDIFVRINSGGTPLSYSDLLFSTVKSKWPSAREEFQKLLNELNADRFDFDHDFILKCILTINATSLEQIKYRTKNFTPTVIDGLRSGGEWQKTSFSLRLLVDLLNDHIHLTHSKIIPSKNALIPVFYWIYRNQKQSISTANHGISQTDVTLIRQWVLKAMISNAFGGQSDTVLFRCRRAIESSEGAFPSEDIQKTIGSETRRSMAISKEDIDKTEYASKTSYLVLSLAYSKQINFTPTVPANVPQQDHLFSDDELTRAGFDKTRINTIYNVRYVGTASNQSKSNTSFSEWIKTQTAEDRRVHLIPDGTWDISNYDDFLARRRDLFLAALNGSIGEDQD